MFIFYDFEVFKYDWLVVFKNGDKYTTIRNDLEQLKSYMNRAKSSILVGFNNYKYDDLILASLLLGKIPYKVSQRILKKEKITYKLNMITLDAMQELPLNVGLKDCQCNMGESIIECPVDFNIDRKLTKEELWLVEHYCKNDVRSTEKIFKLRENYFASKFELVKEFKLPVECVKYTRAALTSKILKCETIKSYNDRLCIDFVDKINFELIPQEIKNFYTKCIYDYKCGGSFEEIEKRNLQLNIAGIPHTYAFGGLHGAINNYIGSGNYLHIDVESFYIMLIINFGFMSRNSLDPDLFKKIKEMRFKLKRENNPKHKIYKIVLNATYGAMKSKFNKLFDPRMANNICINGQIIITQLILELQNYCVLIQTNTDGIIVKYNPSNYNTIINIINDFGKRFNMSFATDKIIKIAQRDVNNYVIQFENGKIEGVGCFKNFAGGTGERNSLTIIDKCLVNYYIYNKPAEETILDCWKNYDLLPFQILAKMGNTYDGMYYEYNGKMIETQKVNRVFATKNKDFGGIYKKKGESFQKIANTSENSFIYNGNFSNFNKSLIDLNYYINLAKKQLF